MANSEVRVQGSGFSVSQTALALKLGVCLVVVCLVMPACPSLWPWRAPDTIREYAELCIVPALAFFAAGRARSGVPFLVYGGASAGIIAWSRLGFLTGRAYYDEWSHVREIVWIALTCMASSRIAASLRWWIARRRERPREPRCAKCGYLLFGLPEPRCPECGEPFDETVLAVKDIGGRHEK